MKSIVIKELGPEVRAFLAQVQKGEGIVVKDENGNSVCGVVPYLESNPAVKREAWLEIERIQKKVGSMMQQERKTEEELDQLLQEDE